MVSIINTNRYLYSINQKVNKMTPQNDRPGPDEKVCYNCKYMLWMVGIGQGVRCGYLFYKNGANQKLPLIPNLRHTCEKFEFKNKSQPSDNQ